MGLREFGTDGRYLRDDLDDPRLSNDLMNGLAFPPEDPSIEGLGLPSHRQDGHRIFEEGPRGVPEELPGLGSKNLLPEDELLVRTAFFLAVRIVLSSTRMLLFVNAELLCLMPKALYARASCNSSSLLGSGK